MATQRERILGEIEKTWGELQKTLDSVPPERMEEVGVVESWTLKDLIGHVTTWEAEAMKSLRLCLSDHDLEMLTWPDVDALNERTVEDKRATPLIALLNDFKKTHERLVQFVKEMSEEDLAVPEVERRIRIDTFAHYTEHTEHISRWLEGSHA